MVDISRRCFLTSMTLGGASLALSGCLSENGIAPVMITGDETNPTDINAASHDVMESYSQIYAARTDDGFSLPTIPYNRIDPQFLRQTVQDPTGEMPGTIVVDTQRRYLYLVRTNGRAIRYGVGIGRAGFSWSGRAIVQHKRPWPTWTPPEEMIARQPELEKYSYQNGGMKPGLNNPLGARALYIFQDNKDTLYRIHGSPEWWSIGKATSSGCVRMMNQDIIDLYNRVPDMTSILVI